MILGATGLSMNVQQNNIYKNKSKDMKVLTYSNENAFYTLLDKYVLEGYRIKIIYTNEKLDEDSKLSERIQGCKNGKETINHVIDLIKEYGTDILKLFFKRDLQTAISVLIKNYKTDMTKLYLAYLVSFEYDETLQQYVTILTPEGEDQRSKAWMYMA